MKIFLSFFAILVFNIMSAQELPYHEIPEPSGKYTAGAVVSRMVDGLGFRYYWATKDLTEKDLHYKPSEEARTLLRTLDHIHVLSVMTLSAVEGVAVVFPKEGALSFKELRRETLTNYKKVSDILRKSEDVSSYVMKIKRSSGETKEFPFWNQLNGPIADAIWHVGQVVSFRRSSGNPLPSGVDFLSGKKRK